MPPARIDPASAAQILRRMLPLPKTSASPSIEGRLPRLRLTLPKTGAALPRLRLPLPKTGAALPQTLAAAPQDWRGAAPTPAPRTRYISVLPPRPCCVSAAFSRTGGSFGIGGVGAWCSSAAALSGSQQQRSQPLSQQSFSQSQLSLGSLDENLLCLHLASPICIYSSLSLLGLVVLLHQWIRQV